MGEARGPGGQAQWPPTSPNFLGLQSTIGSPHPWGSLTGAVGPGEAEEVSRPAAPGPLPTERCHLGRGAGSLGPPSTHGRHESPGRKAHRRWPCLSLARRPISPPGV